MSAPVAATAPAVAAAPLVTSTSKPPVAAPMGAVAAAPKPVVPKPKITLAEQQRITAEYNKRKAEEQRKAQMKIAAMALAGGTVVAGAMTYFRVRTASAVKIWAACLALYCIVVLATRAPLFACAFFEGSHCEALRTFTASATVGITSLTTGTVMRAIIAALAKR